MANAPKKKASKAKMSGLHIDLGDAQEFEPLPDGWYTMSIQRAEVKTKETPAASADALPEGTPFLNLGFATTDEHDGEDADGNAGVGSNRWVWNRYYLPDGDYNPKKGATMRGMFLGFLAAVGYDKDELRANGFDLENQVEELIDKELEVSVGHQEYQGRVSNTVKSVRSLSPTTDLSALD